MAETKTTFCRICENQCGLVATVEDNRILKVEPDKQHVASRGFACNKGLSIENVRMHQDRLLEPLKKVDGEFVPISWAQALQEIGERVRKIRREHGDESVGMYFGNPISFSPLAPIFCTAFGQGLNTHKMFTTGSLDCNNKFLVSLRMYGSPMALTFPDVDRQQFLMIIGGNPAISKMSFINLPDPVRRLQALQARGGSVVHVNPRRTETAKAVGEQVFIRPDTDVFFLAAFLHEVLARDAVVHNRIKAHMKGFDLLTAVVSDWTPEKQAEVTGINAATLRELVDRYLAADGAALYASTGINQGSNGTVAFWLLEVINAITGNLDKAGGTLMGRGIIDYAKASAGADDEVFHSRIGKTRSFLGALPTALIAEEVLREGDDALKAFFVLSGNPVLTGAHSEKTIEALKKLDLLVSIDIVRNETAEYADYILPGTHFAERPDIPFTFNSLSGLMPEPWFQYTDRLVDPPGECRDELWILRELARACDAPLFGSKAVQSMFDVGSWLGKLPLLGRRLRPMPETLLGMIARMGKQGSLKKLRAQPHGVRLPRIDGDSYLGQRVITGDGKIDLAPELFVQMAQERLADSFEKAKASKRVFKLITKRERFSHNSWAHNDPAFVKGKRQQNYLYMHPDDARQLSVVDGGRVEVSNAVGRLEVSVSLTDDMMPGAVALPHGWGHADAKGLSVASQTQGVNANVLAIDAPDALEPYSGMVQFNGIEVNIRPAAG